MQNISNPNLLSAIRSQQFYTDDIPPTSNNLPSFSEFDDGSIDIAECEYDKLHEDFGVAVSSSKINQGQLDYFVRKSSLSKNVLFRDSLNEVINVLMMQ